MKQGTGQRFPDLISHLLNVFVEAPNRRNEYRYKR